MLTIHKDTIFTNVVLADDQTVWWEGMGMDPPAHGLDWKGEEWTPESGEKGAHPNSRFTAPAYQCPVIAPNWEDPKGVPISAILFGGRRAKLTPLVSESFDWTHGTFVGATMASETTAAATSASGVLRRDPMAMLPFCGYNVAKYWQHWINMGTKSDKMPSVYNVNWFKKDDNGNFLWPGYGDNMRALDWIVRRCKGEVDAIETSIGNLPRPQDLNTTGLGISEAELDNLLKIDSQAWEEEIVGIEEYFQQFGDDLPSELRLQLDALKSRLSREVAELK